MRVREHSQPVDKTASPCNRVQESRTTVSHLERFRALRGPAAIVWLAACSATAQGGPVSSPPPAPSATTRVATFTTLASAEVSAAALDYPKAETVVEPPLSLTASDGTGLVLRALRAEAVVDGPLAFTQLLLTFENPRPSVIEGRFAITLPQNAAISRFAMKIGSEWQEAEVVERQRARQAYEDFLHRRQDPALLENAQGNHFSARVFPIPARGEKQILISYSHELERAEEPYRLPLLGLPEIDDLQVRVLRKASGTAGKTPGGWTNIAKRRSKPTEDVVVPALAGDATALRHGNLWVARVTPAIDTTAESLRSALVLVDTSASRAAGFVRQVERVQDLVAALGKAAPGLQVEVAAFDNDVGTVYSGSASDFARAGKETLLARRPLGASNFDNALRWAATRTQHDRLIVVTDAMATAGETDRGALVRVAKTLPMKRVDTLLVGGIRDEEVAAALTRGTRPRDGIVASADESPTLLARRLLRTTVSGIQVRVDGAKLVWPRVLDGVQPGDERLVYAVLERPEASATITLSGPMHQTIRPAAVNTEAPLIRRAIARAHIASLSAERAAVPAEDAVKREAIRREIIQLSTHHRVLCEQTALLVLETEADYARFEIDRRALVDVLAVAASGVVTIARKAPVFTPPPPTVEPVPFRDRERPPFDRRDAADQKSEAARPPPKTIAARAAAPSSSGAGGGRAKKRSVSEDIVAPMEAEERNATRDEVAAPRAEGRIRGSAGGSSPTLAREAAATAPTPDTRPAPRPAAPPPSTTSGQVAPHQIVGRDREVEGFIAPSGPPEGPAAKEVGPPPLTGRMATVMDLVAARRTTTAIVEALRWRNDDPGDVLSLIALGEALEAAEQPALAARAYASIVDLFPDRADLRRFAAQRLERLDANGIALAIDSLMKAVEQRPDHLTGHRQLAYALARAARYPEAFAAIEAGLKKHNGRTSGGERILREDLGILGAAWISRDPKGTPEVLQRLTAASSSLPTAPSTRFVLSWETDANDVDFHIYDRFGDHASFRKRQLASGGELNADVTNGYGPECFTISGKPEAAPYDIRIHYYSRGPMGYGMGELEILEHDGRGGLTIRSRPFVVMNDRAYVDLGTVGQRADVKR